MANSGLADRHTHVIEQRPSLEPLAVAMQWVAKITTVALEMMLPAVGGSYLDRRFGTQCWALIGLVVGMVVGFWHLLLMTRLKTGGKGTSGGSSGE
jgi:F0F1-type ATP synthase assembly protein I